MCSGILDGSLDTYFKHSFNLFTGVTFSCNFLQITTNTTKTTETTTTTIT